MFKITSNSLNKLSFLRYCGVVFVAFLLVLLSTKNIRIGLPLIVALSVFSFCNVFCRDVLFCGLLSTIPLTLIFFGTDLWLVFAIFFAIGVASHLASGFIKPPYVFTGFIYASALAISLAVGQTI